MRSGQREAGLTIVELMVAMVISLLLLAGLVTIFASMRSSFRTTKRLNALVGQQRLASTVVTDTLSDAGYYPLTIPAIVGQYPTPAAAFPIDAVSVNNINGNSVTLNFATAGQVIDGITVGGNDIVATRMMTYQNASPINCQGDVNSTTTAYQLVSVFWVDTSTHQLDCTLVRNGTVLSAQPLVGGENQVVPGQQSVMSGVTSLTATYGVDTDADGSVDHYMSANTLNSSAGDICEDPATQTGNTSSCWPYVRSVLLKLGFASGINPHRTFNLTRAVVLESAIGRNVKAR